MKNSITGKANKVYLHHIFRDPFINFSIKYSLRKLIVNSITFRPTDFFLVQIPTDKWRNSIYTDAAENRI